MEVQRTKSVVCVLIVLLSELCGVFARSKPSYNINNIPQFMPTSNNFTFRVGQVAVLECAVINLGKKNVIWRRASDNTPLTVGMMPFDEDPRYKVEHERHSSYWNLLISDVKTSDAGVYECQVSSRMRHLRHHVTLTVLEAVPRTLPPSLRPKIDISGSKYVDEGQRIYLVCNATSTEYPAEDIDWFRAGNALESRPSAGVFIHKHVSINQGLITSTLEIKKARMQDQGTYVCRTSNREVTSIRVNVLKTGTINVKRGTETEDGDDSTIGNTDRWSGRRENSSPVATLHTATIVLSVLFAILTSKGFAILEIT